MSWKICIWHFMLLDTRQVQTEFDGTIQQCNNVWLMQWCCEACHQDSKILWTLCGQLHVSFMHARLPVPSSSPRVRSDSGQWMLQKGHFSHVHVWTFNCHCQHQARGGDKQSAGKLNNDDLSRWRTPASGRGKWWNSDQHSAVWLEFRDISAASQTCFRRRWDNNAMDQFIL